MKKTLIASIVVLLFLECAYAEDDETYTDTTDYDNAVDFMYKSYKSCVLNHPQMSTDESKRLLNCKESVIKLGNLLDYTDEVISEGITRGIDEYDFRNVEE